MKSGVNNNKWLACRVFAVMVISLLVLSVGCDKTYEMDLPLAVTSNKLKLTKDAGNTHILVYASGKWSATLTDEVKWASINKLSGEGNVDIVFSYAANYGISRKVGVVFIAGALRDTVMLTQEANITAPALNFKDRTVSVLGAASTVSVALSTNVPYNMEEAKATIDYGSEPSAVSNVPSAGGSEAGWISEVKFDEKHLTFKAPKYTGALPRVGTITLTLTDADDQKVVTVLTVTQTADAPKLTLESAAATYPGDKATQTVVAQTNLVGYANGLVTTVQYDVPVAEGAEWIKSITLTSEGLKFGLEANPGATRAATIRLAFTDSDGQTVEASHRVTQNLATAL